MRDDATSVWPAATFLADLGPGALREVLEAGVERRYGRGDVVIRQGDAGSWVVVLLEGLAKVSMSTVQGDESLLSLRSRGDLLGEMAFVSGAPRSARVVAATPIRCRVLTNSEFSSFLRGHPEAGTQVAAAVARELRQANERRAEFHSLMAKARVCAILVEASRTAGIAAPGGISIGPELTQADLASLATVSLSTFEKLLQELERDGVVERRRRALLILGQQRLREIAGLVF